MSVRRKVKLTVDKLERLEIKLLRRLDNLKRRYVEVRTQKEKLQEVSVGK